MPCHKSEHEVAWGDAIDRMGDLCSIYPEAGSLPVHPTDPTQALCEVMRMMPGSVRDRILYSDARDPRRRRLADWWEAHQERDESR